MRIIPAMPDITIQTETVAIIGATRAIVLARILDVLRRDAERGASVTVYADKLLAQDTGLSTDEARRARRWLTDIGILCYTTTGIPPVTAYIIADTLTRADAWLAQCGASAATLMRQRRNVDALAPQACGASAATDLDDDLEREITATATKNGWTQESWAAEARAIKQRCAARPGIRDLQAYTRASLIAAAQAGPPPAPTPQPAHARRGSSQPRRGRSERSLRPQVTYTEEQREAARLRAAARIAERRAHDNDRGNP